MKKNYFVFVLCALLSINCFAQSDSLDVFRTPSKNSNGNNGSVEKAGFNSISLSIGHIGRGGSLLTYERFINNTPFAVFAGIGFTKIDFIGQFSFQDESFYYEDDYTYRGTTDLGRMIDVGAKYVFDEELGGSYFGLCYSTYSNSMQRIVESSRTVTNNGSRSYKLEYLSNEFKIIYGSMNDVGDRFYSDFYIGGGLRLIDYQQLDINEVEVVNLNSYFGKSIALSIVKDSENEIKPWLFFGWKIGARF